MAMTTSTRGTKAEINVTPMIDILLVLLIIFMIVAPVTPRGLNALVPQPPSPIDKPVTRVLDIVVSVGRDGAVELNQEPVSLAELPGRFARVFQVRGDTVIFLRAERDLNFGAVAKVMDLAHQAGLDRVALMTTP